MLRLLPLAAALGAGLVPPQVAAGTDAAQQAPLAVPAAPVTPDPALSQRIDVVVDDAIDSGRLVGAVVLVARDGRVVYRRAAGWADRETKRPMAVHSVFRLASVTKPIVSVAVMRLVQEGRLRLDDPVTRWLPDFRPALADGSRPTITIAQLLSHRAGLNYGFGQASDGSYAHLGVSDGLDAASLTLGEEIDRLGRAPLAYAPGTSWRYSLAIDVLGAVVQQVTSMSLPEAVAQLVTGPLAMRDSAFVSTAPARLAVPYVDGRDGAPAVRMSASLDLPQPPGSAVRFAPARALDPTAFPSGGAGMVATAHDVLTLLDTVRAGGGALLAPATVDTMTSDHAGPDAQTQGPGWGFGYGWAVLLDPAAAQSPQSRGTLQWGGVYGHSWFVDRTHGLTVVALTNTTFEGMSGAFPTALRDAVYAVDAAP